VPLALYFTLHISDITKIPTDKILTNGWEFLFQNTSILKKHGMQLIFSGHLFCYYLQLLNLLLTFTL